MVPLIPTLLLVGRVADRLGRRPLLVAGIALTVVSSVAFAAAQSLAWLFAGELVYGVASGLVMACVSVAIRELHPDQHVTRAALAASVAAVAGLTLGPLVSGFLAWVAPWPTVSPFLLDILLATMLTVGLVRIPETRPVLPAAAPRTPLVHVPSEIRVAFVPVAVAGAASFTVIAWVLGIAPSYLHDRLGVQITQPVVTGLFAALVLLVNGATQLTLRRHHSPQVLRAALTTAVVGMGVIAASGYVASLAVAILGAILVGAGSGVAQMNALGEHPAHRAAPRPRRRHVRLLHALLPRDGVARDRGRRSGRDARTRCRDGLVLRRTHRVRRLRARPHAPPGRRCARRPRASPSPPPRPPEPWSAAWKTSPPVRDFRPF